MNIPLVATHFVENVEEKFTNLMRRTGANEIRAHAKSNFYFNLAGGSLHTWPVCDGSNSHLHGIQRIPGTNIFIVSATKFLKTGHLGLLKIASKAPNCFIGGNELSDSDKLYKRVLTRDGKFHAGSISLLDDYLAVPITNRTDNIGREYADGPSWIDFYQLTKENGSVSGLKFRPELSIYRNNKDDQTNLNSSATAITKFPNGPLKGQYLLAVNPYGNRGPYSFYLSNGQDLKYGFNKTIVHSPKEAPQGGRKGQSIKLLTQSTGEMYLVKMSYGATLFRLKTNNYKGQKDFQIMSIDPVHNCDIKLEKGTSSKKCKDHYKKDHGSFCIYVCPKVGELVFYSVCSWTGCQFLKPLKYEKGKQVIKIYEYSKKG